MKNPDTAHPPSDTAINRAVILKKIRTNLRFLQLLFRLNSRHLASDRSTGGYAKVKQPYTISSDALDVSIMYERAALTRGLRRKSEGVVSQTQEL